MQAEAGADRCRNLLLVYGGHKLGFFLDLGEGSKSFLLQNMIILGEQAKDLKSRSLADLGKQLAFPPGVSKLFQDSFTV